MSYFIKGNIYHFDDIYENCDFKANIDSDDLVCNNGYICTHKNNEEECENNDKFKKCYSFSCPIISDRISQEEIGKAPNKNEYNQSDFEFDKDGLTHDYQGFVIFLGDEDD